MKKYGIENFNFEIIATCKDLKDADYTEMELIRQYKSHISFGIGYNVARGGGSYQKILTNEQEKYIIDQYNAEFSIIEIAEIMNVSDTTISKCLKRNGIRIRAKNKCSIEQEQEIIRQYTIEMLSSLQIGKNFNVSKTCITDILKRHNILLRDGKPKKGSKNLKRCVLSLDQEKYVVEQYAINRISPVKLAKIMIVNRKTILNILEKHNIPRRSASESRKIQPIDKKLQEHDVIILEHRFSFTDEKQKEIIDQYTVRQFSSTQIAKNFNVSEGTITKILKQNGIQIRGHRRLSDQQEQEIIRQYTVEMLSSMRICKNFNITKRTVLNILERHNIPRRHGKA